VIVKEQMIQGSEEWLDVRRGRPTASQFSRILTPAKCQMAAGRFEYMDELIAECFWPEFVEFEGNRWTDRGTELEPDARAAFADLSGAEVQEVGFVTRDDELVGCSPDGLLLDTGGGYCAGLELKCPAPRKHVQYVRGGKLPQEHKCQVHGGMAVTGLDEWHFVSYAPGVRLFWVVVQRDEFTDQLSDAIDQFVCEYAEARDCVIPALCLPKAKEQEE